MKNIQQWLDEYAVSHQNATNKLIHWICVPSIFFSLVCLLNEVHLYQGLSLAHLVLVGAMLGFYATTKFRNQCLENCPSDIYYSMDWAIYRA
jgi:uncharacterized membrane protein YGL010W